MNKILGYDYESNKHRIIIISQSIKLVQNYMVNLKLNIFENRLQINLIRFVNIFINGQINIFVVVVVV
jgi:hypothetical protein